VSENRVLKRKFGPYDEVIGEWRRLHNEKLHALYSPNIVRMIKSRRKVHTEFWRGNLRVGDKLKDPDGRRILKWIFKKWDGAWTRSVSKDRDRWLTFVNTVMNLGFHKMWGIS
jgi:hypothetical protein